METRNRHLTGNETDRPERYLSESMIERYYERAEGGFYGGAGHSYKSDYLIPRTMVQREMEEFNALVDAGRLRLERIGMKTARENIARRINARWSHLESCREYTIYINGITLERRKQVHLWRI